METLLLITVICIMIAVYYLKNRLSPKKRLIISLFAGFSLLIFFWLGGEGMLFFQILLTIAIIGNLIEQMIAFRKKPVAETTSS